MTYRWIDGLNATPDEMDQIDTIVSARGWMTFNWPLTRVRVAEEDGRIVAFHAAQLCPHAEPLFVDPAYRGSGVAEQLADDMMAFMVEVNARGWFVIADNPSAAKLCEAHGMRLLDKPVYIMVTEART